MGCLGSDTELLSSFNRNFLSLGSQSACST